VHIWVPFRAPINGYPMGTHMHPVGVHYRSRERAEGEWTSDKRKRNRVL
jgi:hypothetical protein